MEARIGIKQENLGATAHILSKILADEFLLFTKTLNAHWNVEGEGFHDKHLFFESHYKQLSEMMDGVAERIRILGHYAPATLKQFLELTQFTEQMKEKNDGEGFTKELLADHESIIIELRENIRLFANDLRDAGTSDFVTGLMELHEKMAWMLRAHFR
jgi:starvation-inducible DNA-binding protein